MTAPAFFHGLRVVLAGSYRRQLRLSIRELFYAVSVYVLSQLVHDYNATGDHYMAGFASGIALCVVVLAVVEFARFVVWAMRTAAAK